MVCLHPPFAAGPDPNPAEPTVPVNCSNPVMTRPPQFLSWPKGSAKYPFSASCTSPAKPGTMTVTWEGSWNPSETRQDRPNASETLTIRGYEPFIPGREPGGKIFMYWTARCTADLWLEGGTCHRYGAYVPDDLREAFPDIDGSELPTDSQPDVPFPSAAVIRRLSTRQLADLYESGKSTKPSGHDAATAVAEHHYSTQAGSVNDRGAPGRNTETRYDHGGIVSRPKIFARGVESTESQSSGPQVEGAQPASAESQPIAVPDEGADEIVQPVALKLDRPVHVTTVKGDAAVLEPGVYEIEAIFHLDLALAKEGQPTVLLHANPGTHSETIQRTMALVVPGQSDDEQHLLLLMPDGRSFDARGSTSDVKSRGTDMVVALPNRNLKDAILQASAQPASGPPPPCLRSTLPVGPRWLPIPCTMPTMPGIPTAPVPYVDGSNMLHACLNNNTGVFRVVRPADACVEPYGEVKVK
jgi:hypothetical protein